VNDNDISGPPWQSFEKELAVHVPQISVQERDQILYACAFAAGQMKRSQSIRFWKMMVTTLSLLLAVSLIPHLHSPSDISYETQSVPGSPEGTSSQAMKAEEASESESEILLMVNLDAWRVPSSKNRLLSSQLTEFGQLDPYQRSLTVSSMNRVVFNP
jgi:hypothetical protein